MHKIKFLYCIFLFIMLFPNNCLPSNNIESECPDRTIWCNIAYKMAYPILKNLSKGKLKKNMQIDVGPKWNATDRNIAYMEGFGCLMAGISPWLSLVDDESSEGQMRKELRCMALKCYANGVNPSNEDYFLWDSEKQTIPGAAFIALSFIRGYDMLWTPLDSLTKERYIEKFISLRNYELPYNEHLLYAAVIESFLKKAGVKSDFYRITASLKTIEEWYVGDGWYGNCNHFSFDYYNSFVLHPMYVECQDIITDGGKKGGWNINAKNYNMGVKRMQRYGEIIERLISPEGTFPVYGRSVSYRTAVLQPLALLSLKECLPKNLSEGQVRSAMTKVISRMFADNRNFDKKGFLVLGFNGKQPEIVDSNNTGSMYMASLAFLPLGLPCSHSYWTSKGELWTSKKAWSKLEISKDHAVN